LPFGNQPFYQICNSIYHQHKSGVLGQGRGKKRHFSGAELLIKEKNQRLAEKRR